MNKPSGRNEEKARRRNMYAGKHLQSDLDAQRVMERIHLQTIRSEKIRLHNELERMRNKGQYMVKRHEASNHTQRLLKLRFTHEQSNAKVTFESEDQDNENRARSGLPEISQSMDRLKNWVGDHANETQKHKTLEQKKIERRRKEVEKKQDALVARVGQLTDDFKDKHDSDSSSRRQRSMSTVASSDTKGDGAQTSKSDFFYTAPRARCQARAKVRTISSRVKVDLTQAKSSIARRLLRTESLEGEDGEGGIRSRKVSHVLPINDKIKTKDELSNKAEDLVFDQDMFAPDGQLRTVHLLPDTEDAFREAKKASYLRWRGPDARDRELSVGEMFGEESNMRLY